MSLHSLDKKLKSLAVQHKELIEEKQRIGNSFQMSYQENVQTWNGSEYRKNLQTLMTGVKAGLRTNQAKSKFYKSLVKKVQTLKNNKNV